MRLSERGILAGLALLILVFSVAAETRILEFGSQEAAPTSWQAELGFYLPFVLFALVSTYHFLEWAKKHKREAVIMMLVIVSIASVFGATQAAAPRYALRELSVQSFSLTQNDQGSLPQFEQVSFQQELLNLRKTLEATPYFSTGFNALILLASGVAVLVVLVRMRRERPQPIAQVLVKPREIQLTPKNPREAIIRCYRLATGCLELSGLQIPDSDTPLDVYFRIRGSNPQLADSFWTLTLLFEEAKFSLHPMSEQQAQDASALQASIMQSVS